MKFKYLDITFQFLALVVILFYLPGLLWAFGTSTFLVLCIGLIGLMAFIVWPRRVARENTAVRLIGLCATALAAAIPLEHVGWFSQSRSADPLILFVGGAFVTAILFCLYFSTRKLV
jgi:hypothetical protein